VNETAHNPDQPVHDDDSSTPLKDRLGQRKLALASRTTGRWLLFAFAICLIIFAILLLLVRLGLPWLSTYKGDIEARLSEQLRSPVVIDELSVRWEQFGPKLSAQGVSLSESAERQVSLDELLIDMNVWKTITQRAPVFDELTLVGAKLALEANSEGGFELHGLKRNQQSTASSGSGINMLSWLMNTQRVGLQDATITLINVAGQEQLTFTDLNIVAVNDSDLHQLRVAMQLPESLGGQIEVGLDLVGSSDDIRNASADIHLKAIDINFDAWRSLQATRLEGLRRSTTGIARLDAKMQLELWGTVAEGGLQTARGQLLATDIVDLNKQESVLDKVTTDVVFAKTDTGWEVSTDALELTDGADKTTVKDVVYQFRPTDNTGWKLDARGESLELDVATRLVLSLFDDAANLPRARWLSQANPTGDLYDWNASFGLVNGKPNFSLFSIFHELNLTASAGIPGVTNIGGTIDMQNNAGKIIMQGVDMQLDIPSVYSTPLSLQKLYGELDLDVQDPLRTSLTGDIAIEDDSLKSSTRIEVKLAPGSQPHVFTQGKFSMDDLAKAKKYIPARLVRTATKNWFESALLAGKASNGELLMFGKLADFPFDDNQGVFKVGVDVENARVEYLRGWPHATRMAGRVEMDGPTLRMSANDGYVETLRLSRMDVRIDNVLKPYLEVAGTGADSLTNLLDFANTGPLAQILEPALNDVSGTGRGQMDINISLPLGAATGINTVASAQSKAATKANQVFSVPGLQVNGSIFLRNNAITFGRAKLDLTNVDGAVGFTDDSVRMNNLQALLYGRPVRLNAKTEGRANSRTMEITMAGPVPGAKVLENYEIPLTRFVEGESHWNVRVRVPMSTAELDRKGVGLFATSALVGTRLKLPAPMTKPVGSSVRVALSTRIFPNSPNGEWLIDYGDFARSLVRVNETGMQSFSARFGGGAANTNVYEGIRLDGTVGVMALDGWVESVADFLDDLEPTETPEPILPVSAELVVNRFVAGVQSVGGGRLRFNTDTDYVNGVIESPWLRGSVRYPRVHWTQDLPVAVRVNSVDKRFIDALDSAPEGEPGNELDPRELPPIHARISQIRWDQLDVQDLTIRTSPSVSGLNVDTFGFAYQSAQLIGDGHWRLRDPQGVNATFADQHVTRLNLTLLGDNFGDLLTKVGFAGTLAEGEGELSGSLQWSSPAYKPSLENLVGELDIDLRGGRILKVEPGAARIAGLFALHTIPRRLSLDFKDLVLDGLDYETIRGSVQLANGIAHTPLTQLNGAIGVVDITGESNLVSEQYNQRITVLPRVSAALPIIGIVTGGATAGLGALFAGGVLKAIGLDFDRIGLRNYALTGDWETPTLTPLPNDLATQ